MIRRPSSWHSGRNNLRQSENLSLCDVLSPNSKRRISLREICAVLDGLGDDDVERYAQQERFIEIANYCEREVKSIFQIWLRYQLYDGEMSYHGFRQSDDSQSSSLGSVAF
jgi:Predicted 3'-5' exonuclease related to the exonuclease domain of PolB